MLDCLKSALFSPLLLNISSFLPICVFGSIDNVCGFQARSTQTNPTLGAQARAAPRTHVHMTQQAVQGGFDPFLHCYSHHVCQSRPQRVSQSICSCRSQFYRLWPFCRLWPSSRSHRRREHLQMQVSTPTRTRIMLFKQKVVAGTTPPATQTPAEREAAAARIRAQLASLIDAATSRARQRSNPPLSHPAAASSNETPIRVGTVLPSPRGPSNPSASGAPNAPPTADLANLFSGLVEVSLYRSTRRLL